MTVHENVCSLFCKREKDKMQVLRCELKISPTEIRTAQQKGVKIINGRPHFYTKSKVAKSVNAISKAIKDEARKQGWETVEGHKPLALSLVFSFPIVKNKKGIEFGFHTVRPDADNLAKGVIDAIAKAGLFADDSQIAILSVTKFRQSEPKISIVLRELNEKLS